MAGLTILGTDTEVGKTYVACRIIESLLRDGVSVCAYKPVASGASSREHGDGFKLWSAAGQHCSLDEVNPQHFLAPLAPPLAAELEGRLVSDAMIREGASRLAKRCDLLVVEGAGGLMSPISWTMTNAMFAVELGYPVVLVAENRLGVVNQVLTTLVAAKSIGIDLGCVVLNEIGMQASEVADSNERLLRRFVENYPDRPVITRLMNLGKTFVPHVQWLDLGS